jgi:hypothetical protein
MTDLSERAERYLKTKERNNNFCSRDDIINTFKLNNIPIYEPLIAFEERYSGYSFNVNEVPIKFGLINGGGFPYNPKLATIDFEHSNSVDHKYDFICGLSEYPITFTLDENGRYYEDYSIEHSSFNKVIEELAIRNVALENFGNEFLRFNINSPDIDLVNQLGLILLNEMSDDIVHWYKSEQNFISVKGETITIIGMKNTILITEIKKMAVANGI